jgi:nanoRNase/pAp phosphatase (c-di-AMP/oligoRNAs hydrolase)
MVKKQIDTIHEKNKIIENIISAFLERTSFLILGHYNPDEDCISSMVGAALILKKFYKDVQLYIDENIHEHFQYLLNICEYNSIPIISGKSELDTKIDTIVVVDTAKPSMVSKSPVIEEQCRTSGCLTIEIDHHIGADSEYIGDDGYCLVTEASSASELVGLIALKLRNREALLQEYNITNIFSRNLVLAILTGIIGDSKMGKFLKSKREKKYYKIFSNLYNNLLENETTKETNFTNMGEVYHEIQRLSTDEEGCFNYISDKKVMSESIGSVILDQKDMAHLNENYDTEIVINAIRSVADSLAEESGKLSLVAYDDTDSDLIQFRMRRSHVYKSFDVRSVLEIFSIANGGGHEGAIGFRFKRDEISDLNDYVKYLIEGIERQVKD